MCSYSIYISHRLLVFILFFFFFFNGTATTEIYTLSLHDALPIRPGSPCRRRRPRRRPSTPSRRPDRKSTRLNSCHGYISYAVFCLKKKKNPYTDVYDTRKQLQESQPTKQQL